MSAEARPMLDPAILRPALVDSLRKLDPRLVVRNPVMFVVEVGALITTVGLADPGLRWRPAGRRRRARLVHVHGGASGCG